MQFQAPASLSNITLPFTVPAHLELAFAIGAAFFIALIVATVLRKLI